jgi:hypothetical protein
MVESAERAQTITWTSSLPWADLTLDTPVCALTLPAPPAGSAAQLQVILRQDAVGKRKVTWPGNVTSAGSIPALSPVRNAYDQFTLYSDDGETWSLEGTAGGPAGSIDPLALVGPVLVVEARAQPFQTGDTIASMGGTVGSLLDRSPNAHHLVAQSPTPATFNAQAGPGSPWYGPLQPGQTGFPRVDIPAGAALAISGLRAIDDYLLYYLMWHHAPQGPTQDFNYLTLADAAGTQLWTSRDAGNFWHDADAYHNYTSAPGDTRDYSLFPLLGVIAVGTRSPHGPHRVYNRINGIVQDFDKAPAAPIGLTGLTIGSLTASPGASAELDLLSVGLVSPCPSLADIRRVEQWVAGLGGITIVSS